MLSIGAIEGITRIVIPNADYNFNINTTYGSTSGVLRVSFDSATALLTCQLTDGNMYVSNAGETEEVGYVNFWFDFQLGGEIKQIEKMGTTGSNYIVYPPTSFAKIIPNVETIYLNVELKIYADQGRIFLSSGSQSIKISI
jgi:hypothetical protein